MTTHPLRFVALALIASTFASPLTSVALAAPHLDNQAAWGEEDKREFLDFLETGHGAPIEGQVREVSFAGEPASPYPRGYGGKPFYLSLEAASAMVMTRAQEGSSVNSGFGIGPRLVAGWHLFSWIRYWVGFEYSSFSSVGHWQVPLGVELALIPLGAPHTQYFILRAGLAGHQFSVGTDADPSLRQLDGLRASWDLGLGYEWQIAESHFRIHALADAKFGFNSTTEGFHSFGLTAGFAYMF